MIDSHNVLPCLLVIQTYKVVRKLEKENLSMIEILCVVIRLDAFFDILLFAVGIHLGTDIVHPLFVHHFPEF